MGVGRNSQVPGPVTTPRTRLSRGNVYSPWESRKLVVGVQSARTLVGIRSGDSTRTLWGRVGPWEGDLRGYGGTPVRGEGRDRSRTCWNSGGLSVADRTGWRSLRDCRGAGSVPSRDVGSRVSGESVEYLSLCSTKEYEGHGQDPLGTEIWGRCLTTGA